MNFWTAISNYSQTSRVHKDAIEASASDLREQSPAFNNFWVLDKITGLLFWVGAVVALYLANDATVRLCLSFLVAFKTLELVGAVLRMMRRTE